MEFHFLPKLPKSNLDDRTYQDLVQECLLRIPRYCPEWTDYNPSDPGITLVELFAWLTDQMLLRFNQVPRRNYVAFLELLGIRLHPPTPAVGEVTFYLTASRSEPYTIPMYTEVATPRTEKEEAVVFSTVRSLVIGIPQIRHLLTAQTPEILAGNFRDRLSNYWERQTSGEWKGPELNVFEEPPQPGNCFYLILEPVDSLQGNVIAITCKGQAATPTGIAPDNPPRRWEAWNGNDWEEVLLQESDDLTDGLSFNQIAKEGGDPLSGADVILHLPLKLPIVQFDNYEGYWLRCVIIPPQDQQPAYVRSPQITGLSARSLGGTVRISQSIRINQELLGKSDGTQGQTFRLQATPILPRQEDEYILITPPEGLPQRWQEVNDFANSGPDDLHYTLDSLTGIIQFGPLIREATQLQEHTLWRSHLQKGTQISPEREPLEKQPLERQYGAVPPRGAIISMVSYRTGGGPQGNVQQKAITIVKSAVPYVAKLINHQPTYNGASAESLEDAVIRVPRLLRTQNRAVTAEDFENLVIDAGGGAIARARCLFPGEQEAPTNSANLHGTQSLIREIERYQALSENLDYVKLPLHLLKQIKNDLSQSSRSGEKSGQVRLLLVGKGNLGDIERGEGIHPDSLTITPELLTQIQSYLDQRRLLGVEVLYEQPNYVGVSVQTEVALEQAYKYNTTTASEEVIKKINIALYRFLNPITGGIEGKGWEFGRPVYSSDIVKVLQTITEMRYLGTVQLFELRKTDIGWERHLPREPKIEPGPWGLICSWRDDRLRSSHVINLI